MREIKFKIWNPVYGMNQPSTIRELTTFISNRNGLRVFESSIPDDSIFLQFTGLRDKNGVEIYEGDILEDQEDECILKVIWVSERSIFDFYRIEDDELLSNYYDSIDVAGTSLVIGNIYEHPHLIS